MTQRSLSSLDCAIGAFDTALRLLFGPTPAPERAVPGDPAADMKLSPAERKESARLLRVNHAGEVSAQALYYGHATTVRDPATRAHMLRAAEEENDHLVWTVTRVHELGDHTSYLSPLWFAGSFVIGALAGFANPRSCLGFVVETERQVVTHLTGHLRRLPETDARSRAIVEAMRNDESAHATVAIEAGATELPAPVKTAMRLTARVMTETAYWV